MIYFDNKKHLEGLERMKERICLQKALPILSFTTPWPPCRPQHNLPRICFQCCLTGIWRTSEKPLALLGWGAPRTLVWVFHRFFWEKIPKTDVANMLGLSFGEGCSCNPVLWKVKTKQNGRGWYVPPHFPIPAGLQQWPSPPSHPWELCTALASLPPGRVSQWEMTKFVSGRLKICKYSTSRLRTGYKHVCLSDVTCRYSLYMYYGYICLCVCVTYDIPVVPHKPVAEVSRRGKL